MKCTVRITFIVISVLIQIIAITTFNTVYTLGKKDENINLLEHLISSSSLVKSKMRKKSIMVDKQQITAIEMKNKNDWSKQQRKEEKKMQPKRQIKCDSINL